MTETVLEGWVAVSEAEGISGFSRAHLRQLARRGAVPATKAGRDWLISAAGLQAYVERMDRLGESKHSPWRPELAEQGRGRRREATGDAG